MATMWGYFTLNLNVDKTGAVLASPDTHTPGGSYYFHWARDAALTMYTVLTTIPDSSRSDLDMLMQSYAGWVNGTHHVYDPNGIDARIEPKFYIDSHKPYDGAWCRPQNDAPGLRSITLISYGQSLLKQKRPDFVKAMLWTGNDGVNNGGLVKHDLDWLVDNWQSSSCDLWEEVQSNNFFWNRFTMRRAMYLGAEFAGQMGDKATAQKYAAVASAMDGDVAAHFNGDFIQEEASRQKDGATICALNDGYNNDKLFPASSAPVANTIKTYNDLFHSEYPINGADDSAGVPGILYGRYGGDTYGGGNPWVLTSGCLAQLFYRGAASMVAGTDGYTHDDEHVAAWLAAIPQRNATGTLKASDLSAVELARILASAGDGVLARIRYHTAGGQMHQPEQLDKNSGVETSATDLTWSYATIFKAMTQRGHTMAAMEAAAAAAAAH